MATKEQLEALAIPMLQFGKGDISFKKSMKQIRAIIDPENKLSELELKDLVLELQPEIEKCLHVDMPKVRVVEVELHNPNNLKPLCDLVAEASDENVLLVMKIYRTSDSSVQTELGVAIENIDEELVDIARNALNDVSKRLAKMAATKH